MDWQIAKTLAANVVMSVFAGAMAYYQIQHYIPIFLDRKLYGRDQCKKEKLPIAEPIGVVAAAVYLIFLFMFIPFPYNQWIYERVQFAGVDGLPDIEWDQFPYMNLLAMLAGLVSICTAVLLGFADDILDLRWRHKLIFPTLSSLPLILVYILSKNPTAMLIPKFLRGYLGGQSYIDIGPLYYLFAVALVIFCTNAINIIAGINGVEVGQSLVIASSIAAFNIVQLFRLDASSAWHHSLSLCFLLPFISTSLALFAFNAYPARAFVGDTYCYWAGMTIAVCAITGRFSKTVLMFLFPQVINFLYSCPQLFHLIPCPRHRLPKFNAETNLLEMSTAEFQSEKLPLAGKICQRILVLLRLVHNKEYEKDGEKWTMINNLTILNFILKLSGPLHERDLTKRFLLFQFATTVVAFLFRFYFAKLLYDTVN